ncbi:MAG: MYXO-CTERM sorting domain-containing protein [Kofleriaceae bacterium]
MRPVVVAGLLLALGSAAVANGRPPLTNGVHFKPGDPHSLYVATTFGLLVSHDDGCTMSWVCEQNIGYGGEWDPKYAIGADGAIFATTYTGLRVSRDGGCSFTTATEDLPPGAPNRIAGIWIDALDVGPTGLVWVGTAESGQPNDVYLSSDNGVTFSSLGLMSSTVFYKSVKTAPTNLARAYASGYEIATPQAHVMRTDNMGGSWTPSPLAGIQYGSTPILLVAAVDPANADLVYLVSQGANNSSGDRLYRSSDAGMTWTDVLDVTGPIKDVVIEDANTVFVTTMMQSGMTFIGGPAYRSTNSGVAFDPMPAAPQLACLGKDPAGNLVGCGANWQPDYEAVTKSTDGAGSFSKVWRFVELAGPLACPSGTAEYDMCDQELWDNVKAQFAATGPTCGLNVVPDGAVNGDPAPKKSGGCCDASPGAPLGLVWILVVAGWVLRRRSVRT